MHPLYLLLADTHSAVASRIGSNSQRLLLRILKTLEKKIVHAQVVERR